MNRSETIGSLAAALAKAQAEIRPAIKDSENPHFRSSYADLASTWAACRQPLASNGLSVVQLPEVSEHSTVIIETVLLHESGEYVGGRIEIPVTKADAQGIGSAITYGRRYALAAVVGIAPDDDDAEAAVGRSAQSPPATRPARNSKPAPSTTEPAAPAEGKPADPKTAEYHERIRVALRQLHRDDRSRKIAHVEELSTWVDKSTGQVKAAGVKDYRKLTGKRLEILCHKLEAEVQEQNQSPAPTVAEVLAGDDVPF